ncbi:MAG: transglutaminase domain-containing protein [Sarcina sp.]
MNKVIKSISTIAAVATATLIVAPISQGKQNNILLAKSSIKAKNPTKQVLSTSKENIYNNTVKVENVWGQSLFNIAFNKDNTLAITKGWGTVNPYSNSSLNIKIENNSRKVLKNVDFKGGVYPQEGAFNQLNGFKFNIGDTITLSSGTGSEYFINDGEKETGSVTYKITQEGLVQITAKAENVQALYDGNNKIEFSCKVKPNIMVYLECNGKFFLAPSNSKGIVNTVIEGNFGDTVSIYPVNYLESQVKVTLNKKDFVLQGQSISVNNVWNQNMFSIGFTEDNKLTVDGGWAKTNPYYTGNDSLTVQLLNSDGLEIYSKVFKGGVAPTAAISSLLNGKSFEYGDIIHIKSNSNANIHVGKEDYKNDIYLKLNKSGIVSLATNNKTYQAQYDGDNTIVSGTISPNTTVTAIANGKKYIGTSNSNGIFTIKLPNTVKVGQEISILNADGVIQTVKVEFNKAKFGILNSSLKVINGWGSDALNISFNPQTMEINTSGWNEYLGQNTNSPFIGFNLYDAATGKIVKNVMLKGSDSTNSLVKAINKTEFKFGDIVGLSFNSSQGKVEVYNGKTSEGNTSGALEYFKITQNGLAKYENPTTIEPLNVLNSTATTKIDIKGKTIADTQVTVTVNGVNFTGESNGNGEFSVEASSKTAFTSRTPIVVKAYGQIAQTVYASASNMLESNSGVYIAGEWGYFGKIVFNPVTMQMNWYDSNSVINPVDNNPTTYSPKVKPSNLGTVINSKVNSKVFGITVKSKDGKVVLNKSFNGTSTLGDIYNAVNNVSFAYGDTISLYQNNGSLGINVFSNGKIVTPRDNNISFIVTPNGLVDAVKGQSIYNGGFKVSDYYAGKGIVSTGLTASGWDNGSKGLADNMVMNQAMKDRVNAAIKGDTTDAEKAKAIFNIVSPVAYENVGGNTINTYEHGGVCFNKAQLYAVMGQYAGLVTRVVTGYANEPGNYQRYRGYHSWNQVWIPSENRWMTVDTTWHIFNCNEYVNKNRHSFSVQATLWNPEHSYTSYFTNDPAKAWDHTGEVWNHALYYNFNLGNNPQFRNLFEGVTPSSIRVYNAWGTYAANITFDGMNNTFAVQGNDKYLGENTSENFMNISLVNPSNGSVIFSKNLKGNSSVADLRTALTGEKYKIGDVIEISYEANQGTSHVSVIADGKTISDGQGGMQMFKITEDGLVPFSFSKTITAKATATTGIENEAIYNANIEGISIPNQTVTIEVNGQTFTTKANAQGNYKLEIITNTPMTAKTKIYVTTWGAKQEVVSPVVNKKMELADSSIVIDNVWYDNLGNISFNTRDMKVSEGKGWCMTNPYLSSKSEAFEISLNSSTGTSIASLKAMGSDKIPEPLYKEFNGKSFSYGDEITIDYKQSANIMLNNVYVDGKLVKNYKVNKPMTLYVTKDGLTTQKPASK